MDTSNLFGAPFNFDAAVIVSWFITNVLNLLPRLIIALVILIIGRILANSLAKTVKKIITALNLKQVIASFQLGLHLSQEFERGIINSLALLTRYIILYATLIVILQVLGLTAVADFLIRIVDVIPKLLSSLLIIFIGVIAAGFVETLLKRAFVIFDPATARLSGKIGSYVVISFFFLMALAELGLAATFVNTLFIGLVATVVLGVGLAIGLGSKDLVSEVLLNWYKRRSPQEKKR